MELAQIIGVGNATVYEICEIPILDSRYVTHSCRHKTMQSFNNGDNPGLVVVSVIYLSAFT